MGGNLGRFKAAVQGHEGWGTVSQIAREEGFDRDRGLMNWALTFLGEGGGTVSQVSRDISQAQADEASRNKDANTRNKIIIGTAAAVATGGVAWALAPTAGGVAAGGAGGASSSLFAASGVAGSTYAPVAGIASGSFAAGAPSGAAIFGAGALAAAPAATAGISAATILNTSAATVSAAKTGVSLFGGKGPSVSEGPAPYTDTSGWFTGIANGAASVAKGVGNLINGAANTAGNVAGAINKIKGSIEDTAQNVTQPFRDLGNSISESFKPLGNTAPVQAAKDFINQARRGVSAMIPGSRTSSPEQSGDISLPILIGFAAVFLTAVYLLRKRRLA